MGLGTGFTELARTREQNRPVCRAPWASETTVGAGEPAQVFVETVPEGTFGILGVRTTLGRTLESSDYESISFPAVVLSYRLSKPLRRQPERFAPVHSARRNQLNLLSASCLRGS